MHHRDFCQQYWEGQADECPKGDGAFLWGVSTNEGAPADAFGGRTDEA